MNIAFTMTDFPPPSESFLRRIAMRSIRDEECSEKVLKPILETPPFDMFKCLRAVSGGDPQASEGLMAYLYPMVIRIIRGRISRQLAEEDVAQEVFVKVFRNLDQYRHDVPIEHWVSRIAVRTCLNAMRVSRLRVELRRADLSQAEDDALEHTRTSHEPDPSEATSSKELLGKLLGRLAPKDRLVIEMLELEGRTSEEAALLLETSAVAVRVRAARARSKLKKFLHQLLGETKL